MTTATTTLTDFLLARIAEDEAVANTGFAEDFGDYFTPARVLAECDAKRHIVELWRIWNEPETKGPSRGHVRTDPYAEGVRHAILLPLYQLALPYADHPDYRPEWRP